MAAQGCTQAELATFLDCHQSTVSRALVGAATWTEVQRARIERRFGIPAAAWLPREVRRELARAGRAA